MYDLPLEIKQKIEELSQNYRICDLITSFQKISSSYLKENNDNSKIISSDIDALSYAISRMPATYGSLCFSLDKFKELLIDPSQIKTVLDIGSGTGNTVIAVSSIFNRDISFTCVEREEKMIELSHSFLTSYKSNIINKDICEVNPKELSKFDLVTSSYALNELDKVNREKTLDLMNEVSDNYILIVEPGTPHSFQIMQEIRNYYLNKGLFLLAPCPHSGSCPIQNPDWCHFVTRVNRNKLTKLIKTADVPYEDEKFTFLIFAKNKTNIKCLNYSRIIRNPMINKGFIEFNICSPTGEKKIIKITRSQKDIYKKHKKSVNGDIYIN